MSPPDRSVLTASRSAIADKLRHLWHGLSANSDDTEFMREAAAAVIDGPSRLSHYILWATFAFIATALAWAALAKVDEVIVGEGKVIPSSRIQVVQNLEGGIVSEIRVKAGDVVKKEQLLMRIDETRFASSFSEGRGKEQALLAKIARLTAEANSSPFVAPVDLQQANPRLLTEEKALFDSRQQELDANLAILQQQTNQRRHELLELRSREGQLLRSYTLVAKELAMTKPLAQEGVVSEVELLRLERQTNDLQGELAAKRAALPRLEAAYREAQQKSDEVATRFRADAMKELNDARAEQAAQSAANQGLEDRVVRTQVRAPVAGIIKDIKINTIGGVIQPGMDLLEIVPLEGTLLVEARVRPADIAFLHTGQDAMVKLSAYDFSIYGGFPATLEHISADTLTPEKPGERPESYYLIRVRTHQNVPTGAAEAMPIIPGMVATVDIRTGQKTILHYLMKPIVKTKETALRER